jgi:hypothetical protein
MQIPFTVEFVDGNKETVVCGTPDFIAFEERFNLAVTTIQSDPRLTYLSYIVWNSMRRNKKTDKTFEQFVESLENISGDDVDPKA